MQSAKYLIISAVYLIINDFNREGIITACKGVRMKVVYWVEVVASNSENAEKFVNWMNAEHAQDLLAVPGCDRCRVEKISDLKFLCSYDFLSKQDLDTYITDYADEMRAKAGGVFQAGDLVFDRGENLLILEKSK